MTAETLLWMLSEWAARATALAGAAGLLLRVLRIRDASLRLAVWTAVLLGSLALPAV
jgi:hypothetical protein